MQPIHISNQLNNFQYPIIEENTCKQRCFGSITLLTVAKILYAAPIIACVILALLLSKIFIIIALVHIVLYCLFLNKTAVPLPIPSQQKDYSAYLEALKEMKGKTYTYSLKKDILKEVYNSTNTTNSAEAKEKIQKQLVKDIRRSQHTVVTQGAQYNLSIDDLDISREEIPMTQLQNSLNLCGILSEEEQLRIIAGLHQGVLADVPSIGMELFSWKNSIFFTYASDDKNPTCYTLDLTTHGIAKIQAVFSAHIKNSDQTIIAKVQAAIVIPDHHQPQAYAQFSINSSE